MLPFSDAGQAIRTELLWEDNSVEQYVRGLAQRGYLACHDDLVMVCKSISNVVISDNEQMKKNNHSHSQNKRDSEIVGCEKQMLCFLYAIHCMFLSGLGCLVCFIRYIADIYHIYVHIYLTYMTI